MTRYRKATEPDRYLSLSRADYVPSPGVDLSPTPSRMKEGQELVHFVTLGGQAMAVRAVPGTAYHQHLINEKAQVEEYRAKRRRLVSIFDVPEHNDEKQALIKELNDFGVQMFNEAVSQRSN